MERFDYQEVNVKSVFEFIRAINESAEDRAKDSADFEAENMLIIPSAQSYPLYTQANSKIDIYTNKEENLDLVNENSITDKWIEIKDDVLKDLKREKEVPVKIIGVNCLILQAFKHQGFTQLSTR